MENPFLPSPRFFIPDALKERRFRRAFSERARGAREVLHFTHGPCLDGAACDVLVRLRYGSDAVETMFLGPHETVTALDLLRSVPARGRHLVVSDLSFQKGQGDRVLGILKDLTGDLGWKVTWRDHHHKQWEDAPLDALSATGTFRVDTTGTECGSTLVAKDLLPDDPFAEELARVVRDHDLWLREDPRSMTLQQASIHAGTRTFIDHVLTTKNVDDPTLKAWSDAEAEQKDTLVKMGVERAWMTVGKRAVVGVAYGRFPTNEVLHTLHERGAHMAILLKPTGTFSLRSQKDVPVCHRVAQQFNGGGHPNASGGRLSVPAWRWPAFWATKGRSGSRGLVDAAVAETDAHLGA